jgi:hypothetical protein
MISNKTIFSFYNNFNLYTLVVVVDSYSIDVVNSSRVISKLIIVIDLQLFN